MAIIDISAFRHGETDGNASGVLQGCSMNLDLNAKGNLQAEELGEKLNTICSVYQGIHVVTSDLVRAANTMRIAHSKLSSGVRAKIRSYEISTALRERNFGRLEGLSTKIFAQHEGYLRYKELDTPAERQRFSIADDVESDLAVITRVRNLVGKIINQQASNTDRELLILSTHGNTLRTLLIAVLHQLEHRSLVNCEHVRFSLKEWEDMFVAA